VQAAVRVQAAFRGAQVRTDLHALEQELAASQIQAQMRGKYVRDKTG